MSQIIAAPRWRHFFPTAPDLSLTVPGYSQIPNANGVMIVSENFKYAYTSDGTPTVVLPSNIIPDSLDSITVTLNGVSYPQVQESMYNAYFMFIGTRPAAYTYDAATNSVTFLDVPSVGTSIPTAGTAVVIYVRNIVGANTFNRITIPKQYLIQGANPTDPTLISANEVGVGQFQGGYRCAPEILANAMHGATQISDDKLAIWYRPDMGYTGPDSISYRLVNALHQQSNAACITIKVGI